MFESRRDAALKLVDRLASYSGKNPLVLGIPRGAVPMARLIAEQLGGEVDVVLVRKLRAPGNPEFAIGSIDESGLTQIADYAASTGADARYLDEEKRVQLEVMRQRRAQYTAHRAEVNPAGRIVIVIDDGLATGSTMNPALRAPPWRGPARLIFAVPV